MNYAENTFRVTHLSFSVILLRSIRTAGSVHPFPFWYYYLFAVPGITRAHRPVLCHWAVSVLGHLPGSCVESLSFSLTLVLALFFFHSYHPAAVFLCPLCLLPFHPYPAPGSTFRFQICLLVSHCSEFWGSPHGLHVPLGRLVPVPGQFLMSHLIHVLSSIFLNPAHPCSRDWFTGNTAYGD